MKKLKIGLIHATMNSVPPILNAFSKEEAVDLVSFMDEGLIYELNETNKVTKKMITRLTYLAEKAVDSNVDGILFTCSSFSPYVPAIAEKLSVPVLSSDRSMLERAVEQSDEIVVIATVGAAGPTTEKMLKEVAEEKKKDVTIHVHLLTEAFQALQNGNGEEHDRLIKEKIAENADAESIVLAQYSMARAVEDYSNDAVLIAPQVAAESIIQLAKAHVKRESQ
ncbi:aspartate/glutamate racemase family protein [Oceanobacillus saliphilus]|uniref:aspartate/glutamate racemase family protein n=1 Tax=Oceanobacillus saliphilus TaxID=2925834 RepID=UPI00201DC0AA|nr:aspartate/glutamate racemase family protein [Oceanobacillus saliphilus]